MSDSTASGILIVDDEFFFREILKGIVQRGGFTVAGEASSGQDACQQYQETKPVLVLMDIYMPDKNGIVATQEIVAADPSARILICSGTGYDDDLNAAMQAGARGIIYKPFYEDEVLEAIRNTLAG